MMADHRFLMPFVLHCETSVPMSGPVERMFVEAVGKGASSHPNDRGGLSMCGVTLATFKEYCRRRGIGTDDATALRSISFNTWTDIYKSMFWDRWQADSIVYRHVAAALVDWTWTSGINGIKLPQRILGVKADGVVGPITIQAVNAYPDPDRLFRMIQDGRKAYHTRIAPVGSKNRVFLRGWNVRVDKLSSYVSESQDNRQ